MTQTFKIQLIFLYLHYPGLETVFKLTCGVSRLLSHMCRFSGTAELAWWPEPTFTSWAAILQVCRTRRPERTCTNPPTEPRCSPWRRGSSLWRSCPSKWLHTTRSNERWTFTTPKSESWFVTVMFFLFLVQLC